MVFLHAYRKDGKYLIWGESSSPTTDEASVFDLGATQLQLLLKNRLWEEQEHPADIIEIPLPTYTKEDESFPIPSYPFLAESRGLAAVDQKETYPLQPWRRTVQELSNRSFLQMLNTCQKRRLDRDLFAGESLLALSDILRFAGALIARGRILPDIVLSGEKYLSCWNPILDFADEKHLHELASRIPFLLREGGEGQEDAALTILRHLADNLTRSSVTTTLSEAQARKGRFYTVHDAWFSALRGSSPIIRWEHPEELEDLHKQIKKWRAPVTWQEKSDETIGFRLSFPESEFSQWKLSIRICNGEGEKPFPSDLSQNPVSQTSILALGQAVHFFPPLKSATADAQGGYECLLSADNAYTFIRTAGRLLEGAGYVVSMPESEDLKQRSIELVANVSEIEPLPGNGHNMEEKVDLHWSVTLDGENVTAEELSALMRSSSPLVFFRGKWIVIDTKKLQDALRAMNRKNGEAIPAREVIRLALGVEGRNGLRVAHVRGDGWLNPLLRQLEGDESFTELPPPESFRGTLRPYQIRGFSWLSFLRGWGFGSCLADDMGLGKTIQALAFLLHEKEKGEKRPVLLICPMSVLGNWIHEMKRFSPTLRPLMHHGAKRSKGMAFVRACQEVDVVLTSYALLYRDYRDIRKVQWSGILLDEAQNIKNPDTRQAQIARALQADYRIALTGTPMENHVGDIWSIMDFLNPELLGNRSTFKKRFFQPIQTGIDPGAKTRLRQMTAPFILRRLKTDKRIISDLPEKLEAKVYCRLTAEQAMLYQETLDQFQRDVEDAVGIKRRGMILAILTKLKQICNHPANFLGEPEADAQRSGKLTRLEEMLEEIFERGESALIFTQYAEMGHLLKRRLCQTFAEEMPFLYGGVSRKARENLVKNFQEATHPSAFILSLKAGGTGLNLTRATHVFHFDRWWNPAVEDQATDRAFRIGQTHQVMVHKLICTGTLEERIDRMIGEKTALAQEIVGSGEHALTELSNEALRDILRLEDAHE